MPTKNKPKRLNRNRSRRVARRKRKINDRTTGNKRNRAPRPKDKKKIVENVDSKVETESKK
jgi:hypothetical protein